MYGRMQLADFLVSNALQINNDCLQRLSEPLTSQDWVALRLSTERLMSHWEMLHWSVGRIPYLDAMKRLESVLEILPVHDPSFRRAARILEKKISDAKSRKAIRRASEILGKKFTPPRLSSEQLEYLSGVFQDESTCLRDYAMLRHISDEDLIVNGFARALSQGRRRCAKLMTVEEGQKSKKSKKGKKGQKRRIVKEVAAGTKDQTQRRLQRAIVWVRHGVNHMELLRPSLCDSSKSRLWYLQKLESNLVRQQEIDEFMKAVAKLGMKSKSTRRITRVGLVHHNRVFKQRRKLFALCYGEKKREYINSIREDVHNLGLQAVVLLPIDKARSGESG